MSAPAFTVVVGTARLGGIDLLCESAVVQEERNFELVLVDYWWEERREGIRRQWPLEADRLVHVPPRVGRWANRLDPCMAYNTGLALARGEVIGILGDYWRWPPDYVKEHLAVGRAGYALEGNHTVERMDGTVYHGSGMEIPLRSFTRVAHIDGRSYYDAETRWHACNSSVPTTALRAINGFDEGYDGKRNYADRDLAVRLRKSGTLVVSSPESCRTFRVDPHGRPGARIWNAAVRDLGTTASVENWDRLQRQIAGDLPVRAVNDGFDVSTLLTPDEVVANYERSRPR